VGPPRDHGRPSSDLRRELGAPHARLAVSNSD
jgi:hypothetical protein